jgi:hypothetical protein
MKVIFNSRIANLILSKRFHIITLAEWILVKGSTISARSLRHEKRHVKQWRWFGYVLFPPAYLLAWILCGFSYRRNWFEVDARAHESE